MYVICSGDQRALPHRIWWSKVINVSESKDVLQIQRTAKDGTFALE